MRPVLEAHRDVELAVLGQRELAGLDVLPELGLLGLREPEVHVDRVDLHHGREQHVGAGDEAALALQRAAGDAGDRRLDARVAEVQLRVDAARGCRLHVGGGDFLAGNRVVVVLLRHGLGFVERLQAPGVARGLREARFGGRHVGLGARERRFIRRGIDGEERLPPASPSRPRRSCA